MLWVGLQFVIVVFPDHTHLLFDKILNFKTPCSNIKYISYNNAVILGPEPYYSLALKYKISKIVVQWLLIKVLEI